MSPTLAHLHENEPHPLQDGLLISTPEDIRAQVATWTVLVIIESPTPPQGISEKLTNFRHVLELLYHHRPPSNTTRMIWDQHITDMEDALTWNIIWVSCTHGENSQWKQWKNHRIAG